MNVSLEDLNVDTNVSIEDLNEDIYSNPEIDSQQQRQKRYYFANSIFGRVIGSYQNNSVFLGEMTEREFSFIERHSVVSVVDLAYKMLSKYADDGDRFGQDFISKDITIVRSCLQHLHNHRVPPDYVPGFLILMIKYHFYN